MKRFIIIVAAVLASVSFVLAFSGFASAEIYRWVDENGRTVFSDTPPPAGIGGGAFDPGPLQSGIGEPSVRSESSPRSYRSPKVELFVTSWCPYCKRAIAFLRERKVRFRLRDVEDSAAAALRMKRLGGGPGVPFAVINGEKIQGFSERAYVQALAH